MIRLDVGGGCGRYCGDSRDEGRCVRAVVRGVGESKERDGFIFFVEIFAFQFPIFYFANYISLAVHFYIRCYG